MDPLAAFALGGAALAFYGIAQLVFPSDAQRTRRVLRRTRVTPIAQLVDGQLACIVGTVVAEGEPLHAFMTQRLCVAYETTIRQVDRGGLTMVVTIKTERKLIPFVVVDLTGRVRIDAAEAALSNKPVVSNQQYAERVIEAGMRVRLVGMVTLDPALDHAEHGFREAGVRATITGTAKFPLLVDVERR